ncbi:MAG: LON peptidase substrate-binding domain-containing protein [Planctomycetes bacterium]|nr:LON peptidase substrate-binding domain-containing protein [Planctomycetota bacterium]
MFPLPGVFLFPHQVLPLHIFEPRYRSMVADLLDGPGRFVMATTSLGENETPGHTPQVVPVAAYAEILRHEKLPDGRYQLWVLGLGRVHVHEVPSEHPYRMVECLPFLEVDVPQQDVAPLSRQLRDATVQRLSAPLPLPDTTPPGLLADLLLQAVQPSRTLIERAWAEPDVAARAELALRAARTTPPRKPAPRDEGEGDGGGAASPDDA